MKDKSIHTGFLTQKTKDYSFTILFFIIFSFFVFFVIRPNVVTVFTLQNTLAELETKDKSYENVIMNIVAIQTGLEKQRENIPLLDEAMPGTPQVNQVIDDVRRIASASGMELEKIEIDQVNLKGGENKNAGKTFSIALDTHSNFAKVDDFINNIIKQRRLKSIRSMKIFRDSELGSASSQLKIHMEVNGYYL